MNKVIAKNSFNSGLVIITPTKMMDLFPTVADGITRTVRMTRRHGVGTAQYNEDAQVRVLDNREVEFRHRADVPWKSRGFLPIGTYVTGAGRLR